MKAPVIAWPTVCPMATPAAVEATWAIKPPPGAAAIVGWGATWPVGCGATAFWAGAGGARRADGDGDLLRPNEDPRDGDERRPIFIDIQQLFPIDFNKIGLIYIDIIE